MKWFKSGCVDFTKPDKPIMVEPSKTREVFDAPSKDVIKARKPHPSWADLPLYSNCYLTNITAGSACAHLTIR